MSETGGDAGGIDDADTRSRGSRETREVGVVREIEPAALCEAAVHSGGEEPGGAVARKRQTPDSGAPVGEFDKRDEMPAAGPGCEDGVFLALGETLGDGDVSSERAVDLFHPGTEEGTVRAAVPPAS